MSSGVSLTPVSVAVRIKPLSVEPEDGQSGLACAKQVTGWSETTIETSSESFSYPENVYCPDDNQEAVYESVEPLVASFVDGFDVNILAFGQTCSGKSHAIFGPPRSMAKAARSASAESGFTMEPEYGLLLRSALDVWERIQELSSDGQRRYKLSGSMIELNMGCPADLLNNKEVCGLNQTGHVIGGTEVPLETRKDIVNLAAAVEQRSVSGTLMNDTSSRTHCITILKLCQLDVRTQKARISRLQLFDMMGSERAKGQNSAHDPTKNNKDYITNGTGGIEGIYANMTLMNMRHLINQINDTTRKAKKAGKLRKDMSHLNSVPRKGIWSITDFLHATLFGHARTMMFLTLSLAPRNGDESFQSLKFGKDMAALRNYPAPQPAVDIVKLMRDTEINIANHEAAVEGMLAARQSKGFTPRSGARAGGTGVSGKEKFIEQRRSEIRYSQALLSDLSSLLDMA